MSDLFTAIEPKNLGTFTKSETLAIRLSPKHLSTDLSKWVKTQEAEWDIAPLVVNPNATGELAVVFPDTVVVEVETPVHYLTKTEKDGSVSNSQPIPTDPLALSRLIQGIFGVKGDYLGVRLIEGNSYLGVQQYYISTCNLPLEDVYNKCVDIANGAYTYSGKALKLVRLDLTTNYPAAVAPAKDGSKELLQKGWSYKSNSNYVGDTCHTYIVEPGVVETKIYDKFRYMLEVGAVSKPLGDNLGNIINSPQTNIQLAFHSPLFQQQGFGRVETRFWVLDSLEAMVDKHLGYAEVLVNNHCKPTPFQDSWDLFLQPNHCQTVVLVDNLDKGVITWTYTRWVNNLTEKANGFSGVGMDSLEHCLKYRTMGCYSINLYAVEVKSGVATLTQTGVVLPDNLHTGSLVAIKEGGSSQAAVVSGNYHWSDVGLAIPLSLASKNGKPRNLKARGTATVDMVEAPIPGSMESIKSLEKKAIKTEQQRLRRLAKDVEKLKEQVTKDLTSFPPSDFRKHCHISELAKVAKPFCTAVVYHTETRFPSYMVKVGKKWYKANTALARLLDKRPELPFAIQVWDSKKEFKGATIWDVAIKPIEG